MLTNKKNEIYYSQSALDVFLSCKRRFRYRYLDGLYWPKDWGVESKQKEMIETGRRFHLLAQRYYNLEIEPELDADSELKKWFDNLKRFLPAKNQCRWWAEQELRSNQNNLRLLAKFDLIAIPENSKRIIIYDWKTGHKKLDCTKLAETTQTKLYLYQLAKAGQQIEKSFPIKPENISLIYWNPRFPDLSCQYAYHEKQFVADFNYLSDVIQKIMEADEFPLTDKLDTCRYCEYRPICRDKKPERLITPEDDLLDNFSWSEIEEIQF